MPADPNDRYLAAYIAAYGDGDIYGRPEDQLAEIREEMAAVESAATAWEAAELLEGFGYCSADGPYEPLLADACKMRSALGITDQMSDADRVQVALSTAEARVEELEGEVVRLWSALTDLVDRCDRSELADGTSIDTLTAHVALGHIVKEPTDDR